MFRRRLEEMEIELRFKDGSGSSSDEGFGNEFDGVGFMRRFKEVYGED